MKNLLVEEEVFPDQAYSHTSFSVNAVTIRKGNLLELKVIKCCASLLCILLILSTYILFILYCQTLIVLKKYKSVCARIVNHKRSIISRKSCIFVTQIHPGRTLPFAIGCFFLPELFNACIQLEP